MVRNTTEDARLCRWNMLAILIGWCGLCLSSPAASVADYDSIQAAIDANPGKMIEVPPGDHVIDKAIVINNDHTGLYGFGRIIQENPDELILKVEKANGVRISDISLTRAPGREDSSQEALVGLDCQQLEILGVRISENRSRAGTIHLRNCLESTIRDCTILNYKTISVDDRTDNAELYNYAFRCIDGTGIVVRYCDGTLIEGNRILEHNYLPTREIAEQYGVGKITKIVEPLGRLAPSSLKETMYTNNWHQGSGLIVTGLGTSRYSIIRGNYILNAAQGIDLHTDYAIVSNNIVTHAMIGMKAMHGSKHVLIDGNQFSHFDLWGVMLMPGSASHHAESAADGREPRGENTDGGHIISNNIFSNIGYGGQMWNWEGAGNEMHNAIALLGGQLEENPPLRRVVVSGNMVYANGRDGMIVDGQVVQPEPRYRYAIYIEREREPLPVDVTVQGNSFEAGNMGVSNIGLGDL